MLSRKVEWRNRHAFDRCAVLNPKAHSRSGGSGTAIHTRTLPSTLAVATMPLARSFILLFHSRLKQPSPNALLSHPSANPCGSAERESVMDRHLHALERSRHVCLLAFNLSPHAPACGVAGAMYIQYVVRRKYLFSCKGKPKGDCRMSSKRNHGLRWHIPI